MRSEFRGAPPGEIKQFHHDFLNDARLQGKDPAFVILQLNYAIRVVTVNVIHDFRAASCSVWHQDSGLHFGSVSRAC